MIVGDFTGKTSFRHRKGLAGHWDLARELTEWRWWHEKNGCWVVNAGWGTGQRETKSWEQRNGGEGRAEEPACLEVVSGRWLMGSYLQVIQDRTRLQRQAEPVRHRRTHRYYVGRGEAELVGLRL